MKRVELLIEEVRELTGNQRYDANSGVSQYKMVRALKNAQLEIFKRIVSAKNDLFIEEPGEYVTCISGQSLYDYPQNIYLQNIDAIQWTQNRTDFVPLNKGLSKDRKSSQNGYASTYILRKNGFVLSPPISSGELLITYVKRAYDLEKRSGKISAVTQGAGAVTSITLDAAETSFDATYLNKLLTLCVVDKHGVLKAANIEFTSVDSGTGVITMSSHSLEDGESIAVGDYVTAGPFTCNTSELPDMCEPELIKFAQYEIQYGDASKWTEEVKADINGRLESLVDNIAGPSRGVINVPLTNTFYL